MGTLRAQITFGVVTAAHAGLFLLLALALRSPMGLPMAADPVMPVYVLDLKPPPKLTPHDVQPNRTSPPLTTLSRPAPEAPPAAPDPAPVVAVSTAPGVDGDHERLARTLRGSRVGCANLSLLSAEERRRCEDRLADGAKLAKYIPVPLAPEHRRYYDAILRAKAPLPPSIVTRGPSAERTAELGYPPVKVNTGHGPGIGCKLAFGAGMKPKFMKPQNGLKLGPCFFMPPAGMLSPTVDIDNPDKVVRDEKKAAER